MVRWHVLWALVLLPVVVLPAHSPAWLAMWRPGGEDSALTPTRMVDRACACCSESCSSLTNISKESPSFLHAPLALWVAAGRPSARLYLCPDKPYSSWAIPSLARATYMILSWGRTKMPSKRLANVWGGKDNHFTWLIALISPKSIGKKEQQNLSWDGGTWRSPPSQTHFHICSALVATLEWAYVGSEEKGLFWFLCSLFLGCAT